MVYANSFIVGLNDFTMFSIVNYLFSLLYVEVMYHQP